MVAQCYTLTTWATKLYYHVDIYWPDHISSIEFIWYLSSHFLQRFATFFEADQTSWCSFCSFCHNGTDSPYASQNLRDQKTWSSAAVCSMTRGVLFAMWITRPQEAQELRVTTLGSSRIRVSLLQSWKLHRLAFDVGNAVAEQALAATGCHETPHSMSWTCRKPWCLLMSIKVEVIGSRCSQSCAFRLRLGDCATSWVLSSPDFVENVGTGDQRTTQKDRIDLDRKWINEQSEYSGNPNQAKNIRRFCTTWTC